MGSSGCRHSPLLPAYMMQFYISGAGLMLVGLIYLPVVVWLLRRLWPKLPTPLSVRVGITALAFTFAVAVPLWDVAITSVQMGQLCSAAGVSLKRSVKA